MLEPPVCWAQHARSGMGPKERHRMWRRSGRRTLASHWLPHPCLQPRACVSQPSAAWFWHAEKRPLAWWRCPDSRRHSPAKLATLTAITTQRKDQAMPGTERGIADVRTHAVNTGATLGMQLLLASPSIDGSGARTPSQAQCAEYGGLGMQSFQRNLASCLPQQQLAKGRPNTQVAKPKCRACR